MVRRTYGALLSGLGGPQCADGAKGALGAFRQNKGTLGAFRQQTQKVLHFRGSVGIFSGILVTTECLGNTDQCMLGACLLLYVFHSVIY